MTGSSGTGQGQPQKQKPKNEPSVLLTNAENEVLFNLIGSRSQTLSSAVVQLYLADPPSRNRWNKRCCGVACFIKDNPNKSYYIRVYDIRAKQLLWEQEVYNQFKYRNPRPYFHTFDTEDCPAGLNFANEDEAQSFKIAVNSKLQQRQAKKMERRKTVKQNAPPSSANSAPKSNLATSTPNLSASTNSLSSMGGTLKKKKDNKGKKLKLTKEDIGTPSDFRHVSHVGWDPESGYDMNNLDPNLKTLFDRIGVNEVQLKDKETAKFIYDFIEQKGGIDALQKELDKNQPLPPPPVGGAPPPPPARGPCPRSGGPPPPPSRSNVPPPPVPRGPPPGPGRMGLPPPPPNRGGPPPPPVGKPMGGAPPPPPMGGGGPPPPPPPPPPPVSGGPPPPGPPPPSMSGGGPPPPPPVKPSSGGLGSALMDQIQGGKKLKHAEESRNAAPVVDERDALLNAIRGGAALRPVSTSSSAHSMGDPPSDDDAGIAGALARALASRGRHIHASDEEDSDDDDEDDEFEDEDWED